MSNGKRLVHHEQTERLARRAEFAIILSAVARNAEDAHKDTHVRRAAGCLFS